MLQPPGLTLLQVLQSLFQLMSFLTELFLFEGGGGGGGGVACINIIHCLQAVKKEMEKGNGQDLEDLL